VSRCSTAITRLERLVGLVGGQGVGLEVGPEARQAAPPSFYRLPMAGGVTSPGGGDCYYLVLRDQQRTSRLVHQLVDTLQQQVRATPIPVTWLAREEESLLAAQVRKTCPEAAGRLVLFQLARQLVRGRWEDVSVVVTPSHLVITRDFLSWLFQPGQAELEVVASWRVEDIQGLVGHSTHSPSCIKHINPVIPTLLIYTSPLRHTYPCPVVLPNHTHQHNLHPTTHPGHIREVAGEGGGEDRPGEGQPAARDRGRPAAAGGGPEGALGGCQGGALGGGHKVPYVGQQAGGGDADPPH